MQTRFSVGFCLYCLLCSLRLFAQQPALVSDLQPGTNSSMPGKAVVYNGKAYFFAADSATRVCLFSYDGRSTPIKIAARVNGQGKTKTAPPAQGNGPLMAVFNGRLYFAFSNAAAGSELFVYDGSNPPAPALDLEPGPNDAHPAELCVSGGRLFFNAFVDMERELWSWDGTNPPARHDVNHHTTSGEPYEMTSFNGSVYFRAYSDATGQELFSYDPLLDTVKLVADITPYNSSGFPVSSFPGFFCVYGSKLYFTAIEGPTGNELYSWDGVSVTRLTDLSPGVPAGIYSALCPYRGSLYFAGSASDDQHIQLYRLDTATNTVLPAYTISSSDLRSPNYIINYNDSLYFQAIGTGTGAELWKYNGATASLVADINSGLPDSDPNNFFVYDGALYFQADNGSSGRELFQFRDLRATGVDLLQPTASSKLNLYPNPVAGQLNVAFELSSGSKGTIAVYDLIGRQAYCSDVFMLAAGSNYLRIPLNILPAGQYLCLLQSDKEPKLGLFTKE